jgi:hypothetical protein
MNWKGQDKFGVFSISFVTPRSLLLSSSCDYLC